MMKHQAVPIRRRLRVRSIRAVGLLLAGLILTPELPAKPKGGDRKKRSEGVADAIVYRGMCDASAAAAFDEDHVLVASDEDSRLRLYQNHRGGMPVATFDFTDKLRLDWGSTETDIEGAARVGDRIYWITSHSRNQEGKPRPNRCRFFGTEIRKRNGERTLEFFGAPYTRLLEDLVAAPELRRFNLSSAMQRTPKSPGGLNIEGLCGTPDGSLLIGFRNPVPQGRALIVPLLNPSDLVAGRPARFGEPILLDLDGLGIRDMAFQDGRYVLVSGPFDGRGSPRLFEWSGPGTTPGVVSNVRLKNLNPEAVVIYPEAVAGEFQLFSDDSGSEIRGKKCPDLKDEEDRRFRSVWIDLR